MSVWFIAELLGVIVTSMSKAFPDWRMCRRWRVRRRCAHSSQLESLDGWGGFVHEADGADFGLRAKAVPNGFGEGL